MPQPVVASAAATSSTATERRNIESFMPHFTIAIHDAIAGESITQVGAG